jgi:hypothetical protein
MLERDGVWVKGVWRVGNRSEREDEREKERIDSAVLRDAHLRNKEKPGLNKK